MTPPIVVLKDAATIKAEELVGALIEAVKDYAIVTLDPEGMVSSWNVGAELLKGYRADEILGSHFSRFYTPEDIAAGKPRHELEIAARDGRYEDEGQRVRKDGSRFWANVMITPLLDDAGRVRGFAKVTRDRSELKRVEDELQALNAQLEVRIRERTASLEAFTYTVSHDLRAPLRAINGFAQAMIEDFGEGLDPEAAEYLDDIAANAKQMGQLIEDLLSFSQVGGTVQNRREVDPAEIARHVLEVLEPQLAGRRVAIKIHDLPTCSADAALLTHVYLNLLANAVKYSRTKEKAQIEVGFRRDSAEVVYFVKDNGVGFDQAYYDKLFGIFQRLHQTADFEGTGVGLAIVKRIVEAHGGRVWAEGQVGLGATFYFTLGGEIGC